MPESLNKLFVLTVLCLLISHAGAPEIRAQNRKSKRAAVKTAPAAKTVSPVAVWENLVLAIERKDSARLARVLSKKMRGGGWIENLSFGTYLLLINPARRDFKITNVEIGTHTASLTVEKPGVDQKFEFSLVKENGWWKFGTREELFAALDREIKERGDDSELEVIVVPLPKNRRERRRGSAVARGNAIEPVLGSAPQRAATLVLADKSAIAQNAESGETPASATTKIGKDAAAAEAKSGQAAAAEPMNPLIPVQCADKLALYRSSYAVEVAADYSSPAATVKTLVAALECRKLELGNRAYSSRFLTKFAALPAGKPGVLFLILNTYFGTVIQKTGAIGDVQIIGNKARATVTNFPAGKAYTLDFVKEDDGWKVDLEVDEFLRKAEQTRESDRMLFDLLDFASAVEVAPPR